MGFFSRNKNTEERSGFFSSLFYNTVGGYKSNKAMLLSTVYRCVDVISDAVAQLPIEPLLIDSEGFKTRFIEHPTYRLLSKEPNKKMTRFTMIKTLVTSVLLKGNGYIYIKRDYRGNAESLHLVNPDLVNIIVEDDMSKPVRYNIAGIGNIESCNMIHILNFSYDGITGISTLAHAKNTLGLATDAELHAAGFFKGGANLAGILKVNSPLNNNQKQALKTSWQNAFNPTTGNPSGVAILEGNMDFEPVTVNPADAQLLETRSFNVTDICRFFGVSPVKCFDLSKSSYSTVEATNLSFLTDTLQPLINKIELEFERKLFLPSERANIDIRFDTSVLLRTDKLSQADYYTKLFYLGVISANEIRKDLDLSKIDGGDIHCVQSNLMALNNVQNIVPSNKNLNYDTKEKQAK